MGVQKALGQSAPAKPTNGAKPLGESFAQLNSDGDADSPNPAFSNFSARQEPGHFRNQALALPPEIALGE
jgi:hypothetical protein